MMNEKAHWHYQDFMVEASHPSSKIRFKDFCETLFREIPQSFGLRTYETYNIKFQQYTQNIPVFGAILLNSSMEKVLLGWLW